jgi:hypothetical protein
VRDDSPRERGRAENVDDEAAARLRHHYHPLSASSAPLAPAVRGPHEHIVARTRPKVDNPGGRWLREEREYAAEEAASPKRGLHRVAGTPTAYIDRADIPIGLALRLPGIMDEQYYLLSPSDYDQRKLDALTESIREGGMTEPVFINVDYRGQAWVNEGNHRIRAASRAGLKTVPAEIRYFAGGEAAPGPFNLHRLRYRGGVR